jgi:peptidoglycan/LPS O-acetylase OafA/YrhL
MVFNYTFLFGFIKPDDAIPTGGWSIGNEMFFYSILPLIFLLQKKIKKTLLVVLIGSFFIFCYFAYFVFNKDSTLAVQWSFYVNPLNQLLLFFAGVAIGYYRFFSFNKALGYICLLIIVLSFVFYPVKGDLVEIVSGFERLFFSFLSVAIVFFTFKTNPLLKGWLHRFLIFTGECCYSIYLLHPIASIPVVMVGNVLGFELIYSYFFAVIFTLFISRASYLIVELPSMKFGNRLIKKRIS